jgi:hypothetical protein
MPLQGIAGGANLTFRVAAERLEPVLGRVECGACFADRLKLQERLNLLRALRRLGQDEAKDLPARERDLRMCGDFIEHRFNVRISRFDLGLSCG